MTIRTILAGLSGGSASDGATELACRLATWFDAHLQALHVRMEVTEIVTAAGAEGLAAAANLQWLGQVSEAVHARSDEVKAAFTRAAAQHGLPFVANPASGERSAAWAEATGDAPLVLARRARFHDLTVLGRSERVIKQSHTNAIEQTLLYSGRPVLVAPAEVPAKFGETIAIAWNGSPQSVRAMVAALPLLRRAKENFLISVDHGDDPSLERVSLYLRAHGVTTSVRKTMRIPDVGIGLQLLSAARDEGADLLVLGGYGSAPWRESLLGGATHETIGVSLLPLLVAN